MCRLYQRSRDGGCHDKGHLAAWQGSGCHCSTLHWSGQPCFKWVLWTPQTHQPGCETSLLGRLLCRTSWNGCRSYFVRRQHQTRGTYWYKMWCGIKICIPGPWSWKRRDGESCTGWMSCPQPESLAMPQAQWGRMSSYSCWLAQRQSEDILAIFLHSINSP